MSTSRRSLLKAGAGLIVLGGLPCACASDELVVHDPQLEISDGFVTVPLELYSELESVGGYVAILVRALVIIIAHVEPDVFVCLDAACTHQRCLLRYDPGARRFPCPCHGSVFAESGALIRGPAAAPVQSFPTSLGDDGIVIDLRDAPIEI